MTVGYDESVWVYTGDSYKNVNNIAVGDEVAVFESGNLVLQPVDDVVIEDYSGNVINIWTKSSELLMSIVPSQRMFWFTGAGKPRFGPASEFVSELDLLGSCNLLTAFDEGKMHRVYSGDVTVDGVSDRRVWGVRTKAGNVVLKANGAALVLSDVG